MKNNIKKNISLFLVITLILSFSNLVFAAANDPVVNEDYNHTLELFRVLGLIEDYDNFSDTKAVTRGYFAMVAARLYNVPFDGMAKEQRFTDVPLYSSYADAIELLADMGAINGDGPGAFHEGERIKTLDAAKILTYIAGYNFIAESNGGYPNGYIDAANLAGILKGAGGLYEYVSAESMLVLIANTLNADTVTSTYGDKAATYRIDSKENQLKRIFDVEAVEGVVTQNSLTAFLSASDVGENRIEMISGGKRYILYTEEYGKYLGQRIKAYYKTDSDESEIIYAYPVSKKNNIKTIDISDVDLSSSNQTEIKYFDRTSNTDKTAKCVQSPTVIYNKVYYAEGALDFEAVLSDKKGSIELIDNNSDNLYEVINISAYDCFIVGNVLLYDQKVYSSSNAYGKDTVEYVNGERQYNYQLIDINPDNFDEFSMTFDDGTEATILDIVQYHIMSVAKSSPSASVKSMEIIISRNIQSGRITSIDGDENVSGKYYITLDSREPLETTGDVVDRFDLSVGKSVSLYIDIFGNIVGATFVSTGYYRYGIMLGYSSARDDVTVRLFTADNEVKEFTVAEKSFIDGVKYSDADSVKNRLNEVKDYIKSTQNISIGANPIKAGVYPVRYLLNDDGMLQKLDTPSKDESDSEDDGLVIGESGEYLFLYDYVMCEYNVDNPKTVPISKEATAILMTLTGEPTGNDKYSYDGSDYDETSLEIGSASSLASSFTNEECYTYRIKDETDPGSPYADLVMIVDRTSISQDAYMLMVDKTTQTYDEKEGAVLPTLVGISQGAKKTYVVSPIFAGEYQSLNLQKGDTVRVAINSTTGYLEDIDIMSQYKTNATGDLVAEIADNYNGIKNSTQQHKRWLYIGYVAERRGELIKILYKGKGQYDLKPDHGEITGTEHMLFAHPSASTPVTVYDRTEDKVLVGTFDDIKDYVHNGDDASRVIIRYESGSLKEIMVYND